ncbi:MAG: hypothetical protein NXY57DRAFT_51690 [Lentinula lateritia]|nr:MAG: hypothetical protein NXY57DRAFT_51690 [Lentinula lateritia]
MSEVELLKFIGPPHDFQSLASLADSTMNEKGRQLTLGIDAQYWLYQAYQNVCQSSGPPRNEQILELSLAWVTVLHSMAIDAVFVFTGPFALDRIDGLYEASVDAKVISSFQCAVIERGFEIHYSLKDTGVELGYLEVDGIVSNDVHVFFSMAKMILRNVLPLKNQCNVDVYYPERLRRRANYPIRPIGLFLIAILTGCGYAPGVPGLTIENAYPLSNTELGVLLCLAAEDLKQDGWRHTFWKPGTQNLGKSCR